MDKYNLTLYIEKIYELETSLYSQKKIRQNMLDKIYNIQTMEYQKYNNISLKKKTYMGLNKNKGYEQDVEHSFSIEKRKIDGETYLLVPMSATSDIQIDGIRLR